MKLYIFKSDTKRELRAFVRDVAGDSLPIQFRPWHAIGVVGTDKAPPHNLSRADIEKGISERGFQLWRVKLKSNSTAS
jgi:hypothetical protein